MYFSPQQIKEFKAIYKRGYGEDLTDEQAYEMATRVIKFFKIVLRPLLPDTGTNQSSIPKDA